MASRDVIRDAMQTTVIGDCSGRQNCCCPAAQNNSFCPKILHSMLYQSGSSPPVMNSTSATAAAAAAAASSVGPHPQHQAVVPQSPHYPAPTGVVTGTAPRPRSSSLGSTGSSVRDSCSPGRDSNSSHESYSRGSPMSVTSSPSPSPPVSLPESKLFGILKGTITSPYTATYPQGQSQPASTPASQRPEAPGSHPWRGPSPSAPVTISPFPSPSNPPVTPHSQTSQSATPPGQPLNLKRPSDQDQPIDLSCKSKKIKSEPSTDKYGGAVSPLSSSSSGGMSSILQAVLCGVSHSSSPSAHRPWSSVSPAPGRSPGPDARSTTSSPWRRSSHQDLSNPTSPASPARSVTSGRSSVMSDRQSPLTLTQNNNNYVSGTPLGPNQRVGLAKKNQHPARARVQDWMVKLVHFCRSRPEFSVLPHGDKVTLLLNAWPRILLMYMAENNFEFAVSPINCGEETPTDDVGFHLGVDPEVPTMKGVESIQCFVKKCQNLNLDSMEYEHIRMTTLFLSGECIIIYF